MAGIDSLILFDVVVIILGFPSHLLSLLPEQFDLVQILSLLVAHTTSFLTEIVKSRFLKPGLLDRLVPFLQCWQAFLVEDLLSPGLTLQILLNIWILLALKFGIGSYMGPLPAMGHVGCTRRLLALVAEGLDAGEGTLAVLAGHTENAPGGSVLVGGALGTGREFGLTLVELLHINDCKCF